MINFPVCEVNFDEMDDGAVASVAEDERPPPLPRKESSVHILNAATAAAASESAYGPRIVGDAAAADAEDVYSTMPTVATAGVDSSGVPVVLTQSDTSSVNGLGFDEFTLASDDDETFQEVQRPPARTGSTVSAGAGSAVTAMIGQLFTGVTRMPGIVGEAPAPARPRASKPTFDKDAGEAEQAGNDSAAIYAGVAPPTTAAGTTAAATTVQAKSMPAWKRAAMPDTEAAGIRDGGGGGGGGNVGDEITAATPPPSKAATAGGSASYVDLCLQPKPPATPAAANACARDTFGSPLLGFAESGDGIYDADPNGSAPRDGFSTSVGADSGGDGRGSRRPSITFEGFPTDAFTDEQCEADDASETTLSPRSQRGSVDLGFDSLGISTDTPNTTISVCNSTITEIDDVSIATATSRTTATATATGGRDGGRARISSASADLSAGKAPPRQRPLSSAASSKRGSGRGGRGKRRIGSRRTPSTNPTAAREQSSDGTGGTGGTGSTGGNDRGASTVFGGDESIYSEIYDGDNISIASVGSAGSSTLPKGFRFGDGFGDGFVDADDDEDLEYEVPNDVVARLAEQGRRASSVSQLSGFSVGSALSGATYASVESEISAASYASAAVPFKDTATVEQLYNAFHNVKAGDSMNGAVTYEPKYNLIEDKSNPADHEYSTAHYGLENDGVLYATPEDVYEYQDRAAAVLQGRGGAATPAPDEYEYQDSAAVKLARASETSVESLGDDASLGAMRRASGINVSMASGFAATAEAAAEAEAGSITEEGGDAHYVEPNQSGGRPVSYVEPNQSGGRAVSYMEPNDDCKDDIYGVLEDDATIESMRRSSVRKGRWTGGATRRLLSGTAHEMTVPEGDDEGGGVSQATLPAEAPDPAAWC